MTNATDWTGPVGDTWAVEWQRTDRSFAGLAPHLDAAILSAAAGAKRIVDIGCGAGATSIAIAAALPHAQVVGIDLSPSLVAIARARAAHCANLTLVAGDALAEAATHAPVDLYASRHGVMFFADPFAALAALAAAAAPGARLVFSCFAERTANRWAVESADAVAGGDPVGEPGTAPGPFAFADPMHVAAILVAAGWRSTLPRRVDFAYRAGIGEDPVADAVDFFTRIGPTASILRNAPPAERETRLARLTAVCAKRRSGDVVDFPAVAWIWSATVDRQGSTT